MIALGRLMLATLFLLTIWTDASQPTRAAQATYALLGAYIVFAAGILVATWRSWWLDAKLAGPAHAIDIMMFTLLVLLTEGYTSPVFTIFIFILLSAAIRWGWHVTALSAILATLLYLIVGLVLLVSGTPFALQPFLVRTGHFVILSLILIWFGSNQRRSRVDLDDEELIARPSLDMSPIESGLRAAMDYASAQAGVFAWRERRQGEFAVLTVRDGELSESRLAGDSLAPALDGTAFLYDICNDRGLKADSQRNLIEFKAHDSVGVKTAAVLQLNKGVALPLRTDSGEGMLFLDSIAGLSVDHIELGGQIAAEVTAHIQRHTLLKAAEESAEARSRLTLARDLHDSVVQFLAGAGFRIEGMKRSKDSGRDIEPELDELKQLMLQEQRELRSFIAALRSGPLIALDELARDLQGLADRLSRQWDIDCQFSAEPAELMIPTRLRLDAQQLIREAVANAVRHAKAKAVTIELAADADELRLEVVNDGAEFPVRGERAEMPISLRERVAQAGGALDLARGMGVTKLSIALPIGERRR